MKKVLIVCPTPRDFRELTLLQKKNYEIIFDPFSRDWTDLIEASIYPDPTDVLHFDILPSIEKLKNYYKGSFLDGVTSTDDYPGSIISAILCENFQLTTTNASAILHCQHKYHSRLLQNNIVNDAVPQFQPIFPDHFKIEEFTLNFPVILKPVKSVFSANTYKILTANDLLVHVKNCKLPANFLQPFQDLLQLYASFEPRANYLIAENYITGKQVTLEGFAYNAKIEIIGIVDSIMFPNTFSFERFEYPSSLSDLVQKRIFAIAKTIMKAIGFTYGIFNIEFIYDEINDRIYIVEINPRMASQFADLYEKVDGLNTYEILLDLACGQFPQLKKGQGKYRFAASCVLRTFQNHYVRKIPSVQQIANVTKLFPDVRIEVCVEQGSKLSQTLQDCHSFRYGIINLGGIDRQDVLAQYALCKTLLSFDLQPIV